MLFRVLLTLVIFPASLIASFNSALAQQDVQQEVDVKNDERYNAVCWVQNSAEYRLLTEQTYRMALTQLSIGAKDPKWSADEVQVVEGGYENKSPAVILDVDETVLDNSAFNARNVEDNRDYTTEEWNAWCLEEKALPIAGALDFIKGAQGIGVEVFYVTNREDDVRDATLNNLKALGFPVDEEHLLTKNSDKGRDGNKISRRASIAEKHRIVLLIGDNLSDLFTGMEVRNTKRRNEVAAEKTALLGSRLIVMPNPVYGGWQRALPEDKKALRTQR